ncbi:MAG TPA: hypothetical protein VJB58_01890 [Candidatus Paceibacterota bacterium]
MEKINNISIIKNKDTENLENLEHDKEFIFDTLILAEIVDSFIVDLEEAGFEKEEVDEFLEEINKYDNEAIKGILAIPKELRGKNFVRYKEEIDNNKNTIAKIVAQLNNSAYKNGYTLGFHVSKADILPENGVWEVKGKELDDRDDMTMAYYSLDYKNIYRIDRGKNLYVVRAKIGNNTEHKRDTSNNWGRASSLSIIHKIDLAKIDEKVEERIKQAKEEIRRDAA